MWSFLPCLISHSPSSLTAYTNPKRFFLKILLLGVSSNQNNVNWMPILCKQWWYSRKRRGSKQTPALKSKKTVAAWGVLFWRILKPFPSIMVRDVVIDYQHLPEARNEGEAASTVHTCRPSWRKYTCILREFMSQRISQSNGKDRQLHKQLRHKKHKPWVKY